MPKLHPAMPLRSFPYFLFLLLFLFLSCSVPRVMNQSGKVAQKGTVNAGVSYMGNVSQTSAIHLTDAVYQFAKDVKDEDSLKWNTGLENTNKAVMAYSLDPLAHGFQFYLKAGIVNRLELGFQKAGKANMFETQFQFLGPVKQQEPKKAKLWYGSIGAKYAWSSFSLPKAFGKVQSRLGYDMKRKDLMVPVTFSYSFGPEETYGSVSAGAVLGWHYLSYGFFPDKVYDGNGIPLQAESHKNTYRSVGFFFNLKAGYKYVYIIPSLSIYYQDFGTYPMLNNAQVSLRGWSFVPAISFQIQTPKKQKKD